MNKINITAELIANLNNPIRRQGLNLHEAKATTVPEGLQVYAEGFARGSKTSCITMAINGMESFEKLDYHEVISGDTAAISELIFSIALHMNGGKTEESLNMATELIRTRSVTAFRENGTVEFKLNASEDQTQIGFLWTKSA